MDRRDVRPRHQQIAADLRALIMAGEMAPGSQLPSTQQLVERFSAANATIQRALSALKREGFVYSEVGKGVYVRDKQPFVVDVAAYLPPSSGYSHTLLEVAEVRPPAEVRAALGLADAAKAILRRRLLSRDGEPLELSLSYYPAIIAAGTPLAKRGRIPGGAPEILAELGYPQRDFVDRLSARLPTAEEFEVLELPADVPVLRQFRVVCSDGRVPVEVSILVKGAHLYELQYYQEIPGPGRS
ncbi:GntR family transcriptional regulator [Streptomyces sp. SID13031]|uniref:GntR family transcriptional regulator n=1 Tax=Streptomyces sp. SID13031 TaxID=2706046 RepID=UPI0031BA7D14